MFEAIWRAVREIPAGKVATYGSVARAAGYPGAARQVVWALRATSGLPWHRVVAAGGRIALPAASGMEQRMRLEFEGVRFSGTRVCMSQHEFKFPARKSNKTKAPTKRRRQEPRTRG
ncbi:MAG TPA: MGMT family protein [Terriglobales bacterium]|nr:MGMT family protein [Terriglobales bacterium]